MPKICTKSPISWLVWQIDRRCLSLLGGFWGWPIQWNHAKCCGADPCYHGIGIWARRGDPVAQRLVAFIYVFVRNKRNERERLRHYRNL